MDDAMQVKPFAFKRRFERVDWRKLGKLWTVCVFVAVTVFSHTFCPAHVYTNSIMYHWP